MDIFNTLPVEMQQEIGSYLDLNDFLSMRLVHPNWESGASNLVSIPYKSCTLSDSTSSTVLKSEKTVDQIIIQDFTKINGILQSDGIVSKVKGVIFGTGIPPQLVLKLLEGVDRIEMLGFRGFDPRVAKTFIKFPNVFHNVTKFKLTLGIATKVTKQEELFFRRLSECKTFPQLKAFDVDWNVGSPRFISLRDEVHLLHSIYVSIHRVLLNHKSTLESIFWDFSGLLVVPDPFLYQRVAEYSRIKENLDQVELKEVTLKMADMEGADFWDLTKCLLHHQFNLEKLVYTGADHFPDLSQILTYPLSMLGEIVHQNQFSLAHLSIEHRVFTFHFIQDCSSLKKLELKGSSISSTTWLSSNSTTGVSLGLEELSMDFKYMFPPDINNLLDWFSTLKELKVLTLKLRMQWCASDGFPSNDDFPRLFRLEKLTDLVLIYDASSASRLFVVETKGNKLREMVDEGDRFSGVRYRMKHRVEENVYVMHFLIDRKVFRDFRY